MSVLLLNATYEPMHIVPLRRAVVLLVLEKAQLVETSERVLHSPSFAMPEPSVIRLRDYVRVPRRWSVSLSRRAILVRDGYTCQYCGARPGRNELTVDHVVPQSRGGGWSWTNLVAACPACNARKADRTPEEAGMTLLRQPRRPAFLEAALLTAPHKPAWRPYLWT